MFSLKNILEKYVVYKEGENVREEERWTKGRVGDSKEKRSMRKEGQLYVPALSSSIYS